jgi:hypothetical protein
MARHPVSLRAWWISLPHGQALPLILLNPDRSGLSVPAAS